MNKTEQGKAITSLPDSELTVMKVLWNSTSPIGTGMIIEQLKTDNNWSRSTIQVLLTRLTERGFVTMVKEGRLKYYTPLIRKQDYQLKETKTFVKQIYDNSYKNLIVSLVQDTSLSDSDYKEILTSLHNLKKGATID